MKVTLRVLSGPMEGKTFEFAEPDRFLFGRSAEARCSLPDDPFVSSLHFLLVIAPPHVSLHELGSKNGTYVNGVRYGGRKPPEEGVQQAPEGERDVALQHGDRIGVGDTVFELQVESADTGTLSHAPLAAQAAAAGSQGGKVAAEPASMPAPAVRMVKEAVNATANALHKVSAYADADQSQLSTNFRSAQEESEKFVKGKR